MNNKYLSQSNIYAPCILLSRLKFSFDGKGNSATEGLPTDLRNRRSLLKLSYTIRFVPYLTQNTIIKNFDRLALLYKIISQKIIPALFQLNHINKYFQIMKITSSISPILFQVIKFLKSLSQTSMAYERFECCCF